MTFGGVRAMDLLPSHHRVRLEVMKIPSSYVIRSNEEPSVTENLLTNRVTRAGYSSFAEALIKYVPLTGE